MICINLHCHWCYCYCLIVVSCVVALCIVLCGQHEAWSVGRLGGHATRGGAEAAEDGQTQSKEAEIEIAQIFLMFQ